MHQLSPDLCSGRALHMDFEMLRQPPTDWIKSLEHRLQNLPEATGT